MDQLIAFLKDQGYRFTTPTPLTHQRVNARASNALAGNLRDIFGWNRPFAQNQIPRELFGTLQHEGLLTADGQRWRSRLRASSLGDDVFLHSAFPTTETDAVFFGPDTYRFCRLIGQVLPGRRTSIGRAVDIGCGSGAGAVAVARSAACGELIGADINLRALALCRANFDGCGLPSARTVQSDLYAGLPGLFDLIVSNPPYLNDPAERAYRHGGGSLGSALSVRIVLQGIEKLAPAGTLILYTGSPIVDGRDPFRAEMEAGLRDASVRWSYEEIDPDVFGEELELSPYQNVERIAVVALVATRRENV